ncbi:hypothetical protein [Bdellovibrio sp. KM01]|uniref:hypothetical protein n=1 Tax=Bdellovibrio sp. KM01 TaxID=2748865 RepID=UPI0015EAC587|nr:hypothetical protein [Bdellovibrio sp. KM01]QLY24899.1 hypothetical protein HW988_15925 [Bdellovibrio sp. KM01]
MTRRKQSLLPKPQLSIWEKSGNNWKAISKEALLKAIEESPNDETTIQNIAGRGFHHFESALQGREISIWAVQLIEYSLLPPQSLTLTTTPTFTN